MTVKSAGRIGTSCARIAAVARRVGKDARIAGNFARIGATSAVTGGISVTTAAINARVNPVGFTLRRPFVMAKGRLDYFAVSFNSAVTSLPIPVKGPMIEPSYM